MTLRNLIPGMRGEDVRAVQRGLNEYFRGSRPTLNPSGVFDGSTSAAVDAFQKMNPGTGKPNGSPDGTVGRRTRRRLFPLAVVTVSAVGYRLTMPSFGKGGIKPPNLGPGPLRPPGTPPPRGLSLNPNANTLNVDWNQVMKPARLDFKPQRFPGLRLPIATPPAPLVPRLQLGPLPSPGPLAPSGPPTGLFPIAQVHHFELSPGAQMMLAQPSQTSFTLSLQGVVMIGDADAAHQEFASGVQMGSPALDGSSPWSFSWYAQITDVDRFGKLGLFHYWQPYAQLGIQNTTGSFRPVVTGNLFPVNLGFDINDSLGVSIAGGLAMTFDPKSGTVQAALQGTAGLILKFDLPAKGK